MDSLGIIESRSIAAGAVLADIMVKAAGVSLVRANTICSGRYMIHVAGDRASVATSVAAAQEAGYALAGSYTISNISKQVLDALSRRIQPSQTGALGVVESRTASSGIEAADKAVKRSTAELARIVTGQGINGKSFFVLSGDVASVEEAVSAAKEALGSRLVEAVVIPSPDAAVRAAFMGRAS